MAITENRRMQQLRGKYADLDKTKMLVGEIAVSTDHAPIVKADTNKYYELLTAEDADYLQNLTDEVKTTLADVTQLAIDKVGINDEVESKVQTFSSEKIMDLHESQFVTESGTSVVATDSSSGYATDFSCDGKTEQKQYTGKNLLVNTAATQTLYGLNITVNADKSITVVGTPTQECNITIAATKTLSAGTYILSGNPITDGTTRISAVTTTGVAYPDNGGGRTFTLAEDTNVYVIIVFKNGATYNHTFYPMIRLATVTDATYEPYVGGTPSPNPNYPQTIFNSGDCVEMRQGYYQHTTGIYYTDARFICNVTSIACKSGDVIKLHCNKASTMSVIYYADNGYLNYEEISGVENSYIVPNRATEFNFHIRSANGIAPDTAGKIELTINDKYVLQIKSVGADKESISILLHNETLRTNDKIMCIDGVYGVQRAMKSKKGSATWKLRGTNASGSTVYSSDDYVKNYARSNAMAMCSKLEYQGMAQGIQPVLNSNITNGIYLWQTDGTAWNTYIVTDACTSVAELNVMLEDAEFIYEMEKPVFEPFADQTPFYQIQTYDGGTTISTTDRLQPQIEVEYPTNRVSGVASEGYAKASALSDKILSYQFRDLQGDVLGAVYTVNLPEGVDGRNCTVITSYCITPTKYSEMDAGYPWYYGSNFNTYTGDKGFISTIIGYITEAKSGYAHVNVTVIRNDI